MIKTKKPEYAFKAEDIVKRATSPRVGVVRSVGQVGHDISAMVTWVDDGTSEFVPISQLKKTLRPIAGGKDPDT